MVDRLFSDPDLAALYDAFCPRESRSDFGFYLPLVMSAASVLDVGCGTGALLRWAREAGHLGRLCGLDPAEGMLEQARTRSDIEWVLGDLSSISWDQEFQLVIMTGHAFQVFLEDDQLRKALERVRAALTDDGHFAFETRNPLARGWEQWTPDNVEEAMEATGTPVQRQRELESPIKGDLVRFTHTFASARWARPRVSRSTLRFLGVDPLAVFLSHAGMTIEQQFGDWNREPLVDTSPEIITIARRS